jgi:endonuclease/exonuclease/phosphatase family metal-dependent hydrolase
LPFDAVDFTVPSIKHFYKLHLISANLCNLWQTYFRNMNVRTIALLHNILLMFVCLPTNGQSLRVISYNIRYDNPTDGLNAWSNRKDFLVSQVRTSDPDIIGIQESLPHQVEYLATAWSEYGHAGQGRDEDGQGESTTIFYRKKRFELREQHMFWLSETPYQLSKGWDAAIRRICTYVLLYDKVTKEHILVFNTHFDHVGEEARKQSARLVLRKIRETSSGRLPVVLMGDFNAVPESEPLRTLQGDLKDTRLEAKAKAMGSEGSYNAFDSTKPATQLIDHIFVSSTFAVNHYAVLVDSRESRYPSDHFPVVAELLLLSEKR